MESELNLLSIHLRTIAHLLRYQDYIHEVTGDCDFPTSLMSIISDYLYYRSERIPQVIENEYNSECIWDSDDLEFFSQDWADMPKRHQEYLNQKKSKET
jgi:hypothetical protein